MTILTNSGSAGSLATIGILILIILLIQKGLATASADRRMHKLSQVLNISIFPLSIAFILNFVFKILEALS